MFMLIAKMNQFLILQGEKSKLKTLFGSKQKELTLEEQSAKVVDVPAVIIKADVADGNKELKKDVEELKV